MEYGVHNVMISWSLNNSTPKFITYNLKLSFEVGRHSETFVSFGYSTHTHTHTHGRAHIHTH